MEPRGTWLSAVLVTALVVFGLDAVAFATDLGATWLLEAAVAGRPDDAALATNQARNELVNGTLYPVAHLAFALAFAGWSHATATSFRADGRSSPIVPSGAAMHWLVPGLHLVNGPGTLRAFVDHVAADRPDLRRRLGAGALVGMTAWLLSWLTTGWTWLLFLGGDPGMFAERMLDIKRMGLLASPLEMVAVGLLVAVALGIHVRWTEVRATKDWPRP